MKTVLYKSIPLLIFSLILTTTCLYATSYVISANTNWSAKLPATCANCTIIISGNATLTINEAVTCQNCTFEGGTVSMTNQTLNLQYSGSTTATSFIGTDLVANGTSKVIVNAPLSLLSSTITLNNTSSLTTSFEDDLTASKIYLNDNSSMMATGGASTPINLVGSSQIVIGSGSQTSSAILTVNGPTLNVDDNSSVSVGNLNNVFFDWANFKSAPGTGSGAAQTKSYSTSSSTMNCGSGYPHACASPYLYGPVVLNKSGVIPGNTLPVVLVGFSAELNSNKTITLDWDTQQEVNSNDFVIERSADGSVWNEIGTVAAKGNSATVTNYSFTDETPGAGINYYRLKMVDLDNRYGYTDIKVIRMSVVSNVSFFPNPARDYVNVSLGQTSNIEMTIRLVSLSGQVMQEKKAASGGIVSFPVQQYPAGLYILTVVGTDGSRESSKLMISKS
jgi:hypothetical protein